jgi:hypothetical protein
LMGGGSLDNRGFHMIGSKHSERFRSGGERNK